MHACSEMQRNASRGNVPALRCTVPVHCSGIPFVCALQCEHVCSACSACGSYDAHSACVVHAVCAAHAVRAAPVVPAVLEVHEVYEVLVQHVVDIIEVIDMTGIPRVIDNADIVGACVDLCMDIMVMYIDLCIMPACVCCQLVSGHHIQCRRYGKW